MFHFECVKEDKDCEGSKYGCSGTIDCIATCVHTVITIKSEIAITDDVDDDNEAQERGCSHDDSVDNDIGREFFVEYSGDDVVRRSMHYIVSCGFQSQTTLAKAFQWTIRKSRKSTCNKILPKNLNWRERINRFSS